MKNLTNLWDNVHQRLYFFIKSRVKEEAIAKDLLHDVFLKANKKLAQLQDQEKFSSWIFQITRNVIQDHYKANNKILSEEGLPTQLDFSQSDDQTQLLASCMKSMIANLPDKYKEAVHLSEIEGLSQKEVAKRLNISYSGAKSRVQRGREQLKSLFVQCCEIESDKYGNIIDYWPKK